MIPGLYGVTSGGILLIYSSSQNDVDIHVDSGSPAEAVYITIIVESGVVIGANATSNPAMDLSGLLAGSKVVLKNNGRIQGAGGEGGDGHIYGTTSTFGGGGGGGGSGTIVGPGGDGTAVSPSTLGDDGTADNGGAGGTEYTAGGIPTPRAQEDGSPGGPAIQSDAVTMVITNGSGEIFGGGGGGGGGGWDIIGTQFGGAGGDPGDAGANVPAITLSPGSSGGAAGKAIDGTDVTFLSGGSSPNVEGVVG